ncbi:MAG: sigma 54-interacting transcriptional regulator [Myxococcota bacterium]
MASLSPQLRDLLGNIGTAMFVVDVDRQGDCRFAAFNERMERGTGATNAQIVGKTVGELDPEWARHIQPNFDACVRTRAPVAYQDHVDRPGVKRRWVNVTLSPVLRDDGSVERLVGTVHDFTGKWLAERELSERLEFQQELTSLSADFSASDPEVFAAWATRALGSLGRFTRAEHVGVVLFAPDDTLTMVYEWVRPGLVGLADQFQHVPLSEHPRYAEVRQSGAEASASVVSDPSPDASAVRATLQRAREVFDLVIPLVVGGQVLGALSATAVRTPSVTDSSLTAALRLQVQLLANAIARHRLELRLGRDRDALHREVQPEPPALTLLERCPGLAGVARAVRKVAASDATVLITGETGVGKEVVARALHEQRPNRGGPLVTINCAAVPPSMFESELFGHVRGAFTGADQDRVGRFELADRGTLLLDEVDQLDPSAQAKLLRALQEGRFERVGSGTSVRSDARIVAATNCDLAQAVSRGEFRSDLYYRLHVFPIDVPPLRERPDDIAPLAQHFLRRHGSELADLSPGALAQLRAYDWPGNVRELANVLERAAILGRGRGLEFPDLGTGGSMTPSAAVTESMTLQEHERVTITQVLERSGWTIEGPEGAASQLGLNPSTLRARMRKFGISRPSG